MTGFFNKLKSALSKTSSKIGSGIEYLFVLKKLDSQTLEELEDLLLTADIGSDVTNILIEALRTNKFNKEITSLEVKKDLSNNIESILNGADHSFPLFNGLNVILVCGVNGNGKTTTIGKMAANSIKEGKKVAIAACDTYRAAAVEQIEKWAKDAGATLYKGGDKAEPASVAHMSVTESLKNGTDVLFIDTAGRLHNHKNLMEELAKIIRVIKKIDPSFPSHTLLVIDGTTGQNASSQVEQFKLIADISGLIITKLDGTAKAGAVVGIVKKFALPVHYIGIGEKMEDLKPFSASDFSKALVGLEE